MPTGMVCAAGVRVVCRPARCCSSPIGQPPLQGDHFQLVSRQCVAAGLRSPTEFEIMAFLGHKTTDKARTYTKKANRKSLPTADWARWRGQKGTGIVQPCQKVGHRRGAHIEKAEQPETGGTPKGNNLRTPSVLPDISPSKGGDCSLRSYRGYSTAPTIVLSPSRIDTQRPVSLLACRLRYR